MNDRLSATFRRQHGVVSRQQARASGLSLGQIRARVAAGLWVELSPGVYRHSACLVTPEQSVMAAVLAAGAGSVASHGAAAYLWDMLGWREAGERPAVTVSTPFRPRSYGFDLHRTKFLDPRSIRIRRGIPCTDPSRTLVDLAVTESHAGSGWCGLDRALDQALAAKLVTVAGLMAEIRRRAGHGRTGTARLRHRLHERGFVGGPAPSALESRGMAFLRRYRIPVVSRELKTGPDGEFRIDFVLGDEVTPGGNIAWELDGYVWHFTPEHKSRDDQRRNVLRLQGWDVYVTDWRTLANDPDGVAAVLRAALSLRRTPAPP